MNAKIALTTAAVLLFKALPEYISSDDLAAYEAFEGLAKELDAASKIDNFLGEDDALTLGSLQAGFRQLGIPRASDAPERTLRRSAYATAAAVLLKAGHDGVAPGRQFARTWVKLITRADDAKDYATSGTYQRDLHDLGLDPKVTRL